MDPRRETMWRLKSRVFSKKCKELCRRSDVPNMAGDNVAVVRGGVIHNVLDEIVAILVTANYRLLATCETITKRGVAYCQ